MNETQTNTNECQVCNKVFNNKRALSMHNLRVHSGKEWATRKKYPSQSLEYKRMRYREKQAEYRSKGLNAHGEPFKTEWGKRISETHRNQIGIGTPQRKRRQKRKRIEPFVLRAGEVTPTGVKFCPFCGNNIEKLL